MAGGAGNVAALADAKVFGDYRRAQRLGQDRPGRHSVQHLVGVGFRSQDSAFGTEHLGIAGVGVGLALPSSGDTKPSPHSRRFCGSSSSIQDSGIMSVGVELAHGCAN